MTPRPSAPSWSARLGEIAIAAPVEFVSLLFEPPLGLDFAGDGSRASRTSRGCATATATAAAGRAAGAGDASTREAKRMVATAVTFMVMVWKLVLMFEGGLVIGFDGVA
jgi:hypothetical protein